MTAALRARRLAAGAAAGIVATLAIPSLAAAGNVLAWGDNSGAQLGNGSTASLSLTPVQVQLPAGAMVRAIMAGAVHALARAAKGHVLAWGFNDHGQIGDGSDNLRVPPGPGEAREGPGGHRHRDRPGCRDQPGHRTEHKTMRSALVTRISRRTR